MTSELISIPNIYETPYCSMDVILDNTNFTFEYNYNIRADKTYLTIYRIENEEKIYLVKSFQLSTFSGNILRNSQDTAISGGLFFENKNNSVNDSEPTIKNISTDYQLSYASE